MNSTWFTGYAQHPKCCQTTWDYRWDNDSIINIPCEMIYLKFKKNLEFKSTWHKF